ncbi:MAG: type 2 isopentenyl-diphosphate Delta-isomerase [Bacillota bacterium]
MADEKRVHRKIDHLHHAVSSHTSADHLFDDLILIHQSLSCYDWDEIDLTGRFVGREWPVPLYINAVTGGAPEALDVNRFLARSAAAYGIPMAVGSQTAALNDPALMETYSIVRKVNPDGVIWANLGAYATVAMARQAVSMLQADAIQIHLNTPQELAMPEGDRHFRGTWERIGEITSSVGVPVIVKEVGFGLSYETVARLEGLSIAAYDVGGRGGTNFVAIEQQRTRVSGPFRSWGIPTAVSLVETLDACCRDIPVFASGGITDGLVAAKAIALGASAVGLAGVLVKALARGGEAEVNRVLRSTIDQLRTAMLLTNARTLNDLRRVPLILRGDLLTWLAQRGVDLSQYAQRGSIRS